MVFVVSLVSSLAFSTLAFIQPANAVTQYNFDCLSVGNSVPRSVIDGTSNYLNFPPEWGSTPIEIDLGTVANNPGGVEIELVFQPSCEMWFIYGHPTIPNEDGVLEAVFTKQLIVPLDGTPVGVSGRSWSGSGYPADDPIGHATYFFTAGSNGGGQNGGNGSSAVERINYFVVEGFPRFKSTLNTSMKNFIGEQVAESGATINKVVCTGTVRGSKWTAKREALALARATAGCDYVETLLPSVETELRKRLISKKKQNSLTVRISVFKSGYVAPPA